MTNLTYLDVRDNQINTNFDYINKLTNLIHLHIFNHKNETIEFLEKLVNLTNLNYSKHLLSDIPAKEMASLLKLTNLTILNQFPMRFRNHKIESLDYPRSIKFNGGKIENLGY